MNYLTEFDKLISDFIKPLFKENGFRKSNLNFYKSESDITQVFNIQRSVWDSPDDISFTFNIGFYHKEIYEEVFERTAPKTPSDSSCIISFRSGSLIHGKDYWYNFKDFKSFDELVSVLFDDIHKSTFDLFTMYNSLESIPKLFRRKPELKPFIPLFVMFSILSRTGAMEEAVGLLKKEYSLALNPKDYTRTTKYPDGSCEEETIKGEINPVLIERIERLARKHQIDLKKYGTQH